MTTKKPMKYPEVEEMYIKHNIKGMYHFESTDEVLAVLGYDIRGLKGYSHIPNDWKSTIEYIIIRFINGWGLEARELLNPVEIRLNKRNWQLVMDDGTYYDFNYFG